MVAEDERYWDAEVSSVAVVDHWRLHLEFADGHSGDVDVSYLRRKPGLFKELRDPNYFARVFLDDDQGTVAWPNGVDVAAHVLRARLDQEARRRERLEEEALMRSLVDQYAKAPPSRRGREGEAEAG